MRKKLKKLLESIGIDARDVHERLSGYSIKLALKNNRYSEILEKLRAIVPDISDQESSEALHFNDYWELKRRALQAFQCDMMLKALEKIGEGKKEVTVIDIGDSAGTHMLYLKELAKDRFDIKTVSVNLDLRAIKKIEARGLKAMLCRAEDVDLGDKKVDMFTSFQMVEHLHNPAIFFRRLAKKSSADRMVITVPYLKKSRVGLHHIRHGQHKKVFAEDVHVFELNPADWTLLVRHGGWKVIYSQIYYQYPRHIPLLSSALSFYWKTMDFEGFWGAILEKDTAISDSYQNWE
ncbi:MAG: methyltransferase domain-containing protein [Thermodesulfovibrionales bacterium]|nr:methyltransferase domain-containing protein [Thermodesulfovibrionales bacterium]